MCFSIALSLQLHHPFCSLFATLTIEDESNLSFYMFLQIYAVNVAGTGPFATATIPSDCAGLETPDALVTCKFASVF